MSTRDLIANYTPAVDIVSLIICAILGYVIERVLFFSNDKKFVYLKRAVAFILFASFDNIAFYMVINYCGNATVVIFALRIFYHLMLLLALYTFLLYMKEMIDVKRKIEDMFMYITRILFTICFVLEMLSPYTKLGFWGENGLWYDPVISPYTCFYVYAYAMLYLVLIFYSKRIIRFVRICLGITGTVVAAIMLYQAICNINTYTSFTYVLPIFVVMILLHSKPFDDKTGALNLASFDNYIQQKAKQSVPVEYISLQLNISMLDSLPDELGKVLNSFWHSTFKEALSFELSRGAYVLAIPKVKKNKDVSKKIDKLVNEVFTGYYEQYHLPYKLIVLSELDFIENAADVIGIVKYLSTTIEENTTLRVDDKRRNELRTMKQVKETLADIERQGNMDDPRVKVYCQPIRNMKTGEFDTAEALMRLSMDGVGIVPPYMFVTMAEEYGYIHTLTKIITNKVSKKVKELENEGYRFLRISVNVTATDINIDGFCEEMVSIIKGNGVDPSKIGIELTESRNDSDFMILKEKMKKLRKAGMTLYLDDIGTGYSNLDRIVQYDVDVVKFDRFFLLEAEKSDKIVKMMTHLSQAFKDLEYTLLFEGVESEEHEKLCMACGADYIQGFKYSKPVPADELRLFFEKDEDEIIYDI